jgi:hypothetical protein
MLTFFSPDVREGFDAMLEHRAPEFPSAVSPSADPD